MDEHAAVIDGTIQRIEASTNSSKADDEMGFLINDYHSEEEVLSTRGVSNALGNHGFSSRSLQLMERFVNPWR